MWRDATPLRVRCGPWTNVVDLTIFAALHRFLAQDNVSLGFLAVWAVSDFCVLFRTVTSIDYLPAEDIDTTDEYLFGQTMAIIPFALLLPRIKESGIGGQHSTAETNGCSALILCSSLVPPRSSMVSTFKRGVGCSSCTRMGIV